VAPGPAEDPLSSADPPDDAYIVVLVARGGARLQPGERLQINELQTDAGPATVFLMTRFQEIGLPHRLPQELILEVRCPGSDIDDAVARAATLATSLTPVISFTVNAFVDLPFAHLAYEGSPGRTTRRFWEAEADLGVRFPNPTRLLRADRLFPLLGALFTSPEHKRLGRAVSMYHAALRNWTTASQPLALTELYPALEALSPAAERAERQRLGLRDERAHASHRGVDVSKSNWRDVLLGWVRRDVICQRDKDTYDAVRKLSDKLEHGALDMPLIREAAPRVTGKLFDYVRRGMLDLMDLDPAVREALASTRPLDITPIHSSITGVLTGDVSNPDRLGDDEPYPRLDWQTAIEEYTPLPDGRATIKPRITWTARIAPGVFFTADRHRVAVGLNDPADFDVPDASRASDTQSSLDQGEKIGEGGWALSLSSVRPVSQRTDAVNCN
jgi:hypothetical protein